MADDIASKLARLTADELCGLGRSYAEKAASGAGAPSATDEPGTDLLIGVLARPKRGGRWLLVAQDFDDRTAAERMVRELRVRFPEQELRVVVMGFPSEHLGDLPGDGPVQLGEATADVLAVHAALIGLLDDEARSMTRRDLARRRRGVLGIHIVRGTKT